MIISSPSGAVVVYDPMKAAKYSDDKQEML